MSYAVQRAMAWCGVPLIVLTLVGFLLADLLPVPPGANLSPEQVAQFYSANPTMSRLGFLLATIGLGCLAPLVALISIQMLRIDGVPAPLANLQQIAGTGVLLAAVVPCILMNVAAFRPDRDPVVTQAINDAAWLLLITPIVLFVLQEVPIAVAIFMDRSARPIFPRWVGYANLWIPLTFLPAMLPYFFKSGLLARNPGLLPRLGHVRGMGHHHDVGVAARVAKPSRRRICLFRNEFDTRLKNARIVNPTHMCVPRGRQLTSW